MIGYHHFSQAEVCWKVHLNVIMPLTMPHATGKLSLSCAQRILKDQKAALIRWDSGFDKYAESEWWYVVKDKSEDFSAYSKKMRYILRKASEIFIAERCGRETIIRDGYRVYCEAYRRYDTYEPRYTELEFQRAIDSLPDKTEFWVVQRRGSGEIVAFSENVVSDDACFYLSMWLVPEEMKQHAGYLLFHEMNKYYLNELGLKYVSDGARNLSHKTTIHQFLISRFGFRKAYAKLKVAYSPLLYPFVLMLYPFRILINKLPGSIFRKVSVVLAQESIRRACSKLPEVP